MEEIEMYKYCMSPYLEIFKKNDRILIFNKLTKITYSISKNEYVILKKLDGTNTIRDICLSCDFFSNADIRMLINIFEQNGFIKGKEKKKRFNVFKIKKGIINVDKIINNKSLLIRSLRFFIIYLSLPLFIVGVLQWKKYSYVEFDINSLINTNYLILISTLFIATSLHELAHAIIAKYNGAFVAEMGVMLYWFIPCGYTTIIGTNMIESKLKRLQIFLAGILTNLNLAGSSLLLMCITTGKVNNYLYLFTLINIGLIFTNLLIFLKLDGYYILQELFNERKLRENSFIYIKSILNFKVKKESCNNNQRDILSKIVYLIYGWLSILYIPIMLIGIILDLVYFVFKI